MATDIRVILPNRHGAAVGFLDAVAAAGINVEGVAGDLRGGENWGYLHILVSDEQGDTARRAAEDLGLEVTTVRGVEVVEIDDEPGSLARALKAYAEAGRNIDVLYVASANRIVVGTEDMWPERPGIKMSET